MGNYDLGHTASYVPNDILCMQQFSMFWCEATESRLLYHTHLLKEDNLLVM